MTDTLTPPSELGEISDLGDGWEIRFERRLRHSPERVWKALTTPEGLACWLAEADIDLTPGGRMDLNFRQPDHEFMPDTPDRRIQNNEVLVVEPYTRFEHTFGSNDESVVSWRLTPDGDGTHVQLIHRIPQGWAGGRANVMTGWRTHLEGLEDAIHGVRHGWDWDLFLARREDWLETLA